MDAFPGLQTSSSDFDQPAWGTLGIPLDENHARLIYKLETEYAVLRYTIYKEGARVAAYTHTAPALVYGVGGPCAEFDGNGDGGLVKRRLTFYPRGSSHSLQYFGKTRLIALDLLDKSYDWPTASTALPATIYDDVWRMMLVIAEGGDLEAAGLAIARLLSSAHSYLHNQPPAWIKDAIGFLHEDWQLVPSTTFIARSLGVSPQHLCRTFRRHMGLTIQQYAVALRVDHARGLLWHSGAPISQIALEAGFADQSHLTRALSEHSGWSPRKLRLLLRAARQRARGEWLSAAPRTPKS